MRLALFPPDRPPTYVELFMPDNDILTKLLAELDRGPIHGGTLFAEVNWQLAPNLSLPLLPDPEHRAGHADAISKFVLDLRGLALKEGQQGNLPITVMRAYEVHRNNDPVCRVKMGSVAKAFAAARGLKYRSVLLVPVAMADGSIRRVQLSRRTLDNPTISRNVNPYSDSVLREIFASPVRVLDQAKAYLAAYSGPVPKVRMSRYLALVLAHHRGVAITEEEAMYCWTKDVCGLDSQLPDLHMLTGEEPVLVRADHAETTVREGTHEDDPQPILRARRVH